MKRVMIGIGFLIVLFAGSGISTAHLRDGLVAYYPFNGNPNDESGNGHNATLHGAVPTADRFGNPNSAYETTGNYSGWGGGNYIELPDVIEGFPKCSSSSGTKLDTYGRGAQI